MTNLHQASLPTVRAEFYTITQQEKETILAYTSRVDIIVATLAKLGEKVSTGAWIYALGNGLRQEFKECRDGILYSKTGFDNVMSVKTKLLSEEAVLTSKSKKHHQHAKTTTDVNDEIALKLQETKLSKKTAKDAAKESKDKAAEDAALLYIKGKGGKGPPKSKDNGWNTWNDPQWNQPWTAPAKGKGKGKDTAKPFDPQGLWCDIHQKYGHSTEWCFDNPNRTGGKPTPATRPWCDSCNSYGHTSATCWANPSGPPKGKGKSQYPKGKGGKGKDRYGDRQWKSPNFPAGYTEQATPALHDESSTNNTSELWWDDSELSSVCMATLDTSDEYDDDDLSAELDLYFIAYFSQIERQPSYFTAPTADKLDEFNTQEENLQHSVHQLNIHSQRILETFRGQVGYVGCMETFVATKRILEDERKDRGFYMTQASKPDHETRPDAAISNGPCLSHSSPRDRELHYELPLVGGSELDLAGQASPASAIAAFV
jgi:hypothetical protein